MSKHDCKPSIAGKKTVFLRCHIYLETTILPRQARDKHRETALKKQTSVFLQAPLGSTGCGTIVCVTCTGMSAVGKNGLFEMPFIHKKRAFYQDRLGTNMGKLEKERPFVLR
eukprot:COSAG06_NODE_612_length_13800_cov_14.100650_13_plen_112_part_00